MHGARKKIRKTGRKTKTIPLRQLSGFNRRLIWRKCGQIFWRPTGWGLTIIVKAFFDRCRQVAETECPSSPVLKAINYALNIEENLEKFLDNPQSSSAEKNFREIFA